MAMLNGNHPQNLESPDKFCEIMMFTTPFLQVIREAVSKAREFFPFTYGVCVYFREERGA
jgi:hypothetical protein